jgi:FkbM family methyltransferase
MSLARRLIPSRLRKLRWEYKLTRRYAEWLLNGGEEEAALLPSLCDRRLVSVDIGANLGGYTWLLRRFSKSVIAFEPNPDLAARLTRLMRVAPSVTVHNCALSDSDGTVVLRIPDDHGRSTLEAANTLHGRETREVPVPARRLDGIVLGRVGFIKIDVEGHELAVLRGAERLLRDSHPNLLIEATDEHRAGALASVREFLAALGYVCSVVRDGALTPLGSSDAPPDAVENFVFQA